MSDFTTDPIFGPNGTPLPESEPAPETGGGGSGSLNTTTSTGTVSRQQWAVAILNGLGAPVTSENIAAMLAWMQGENTRAGNNPLATTQPVAGHESFFNSFGDQGQYHVRNYDSFEVGLQATLTTLRNGHYGGIIDALVRGTTINELSGLVVASPWGTKHFGDGSGGDVNVNGDAGDTSSLPTTQEELSGLAGTGPDTSVDPLWVPPAGGQLFNSPTGGWVVRYQVVPGVFIEWVTADAEALARAGYQTGSAQTYTDQVGVNQSLKPFGETGDLSEIAGIADEGYGTVSEWYEDTLLSAFGSNSEAAADVGIQGVILEMLSNPDISEARLQLLVEGTEFWRNTNDAKNVWRDLSPAEQQQRIFNIARDLVEDHRRIMGNIGGRPLSVNDPSLLQFAENVASGEANYNQVLQRFEDAAMEVETSPFFQQARDLDIRSRQFGIDTENLSQQLKDQARQWGVSFPEDSYTSWADSIMRNFSSAADFEQALEQQASVMYPNRPAGMRTLDYAQPWLTTLGRTLETGADLMDDRIQGALQSGVTAFDFQRQLMNSEEWLHTENATDKLVGAMGSAAQLMGFA